MKHTYIIATKCISEFQGTASPGCSLQLKVYRPCNTRYFQFTCVPLAVDDAAADEEAGLELLWLDAEAAGGLELL